MSALKKRLLYPSSSSTSPRADTQENLRKLKIESEAIREKLQKSILDNPKLAQKAALIISLWINGKSKR